jgi:hypothetical protein
VADDGHLAQGRLKSRLDRRPHDRHHDEDRPEAVDDARDVREELDREGDGRADRAWRELREVDRGTDRNGSREQNGDDRRHQRAVDVRGRAEDQLDRIPLGRREVREAERRQRRPRIDEDEQRDRDERARHQHRQCRHARREDPIEDTRHAGMVTSEERQRRRS